jgi:hypothetical protein
VPPVYVYSQAEPAAPLQCERGQSEARVARRRTAAHCAERVRLGAAGLLTHQAMMAAMMPTTAIPWCPREWR